MLCLPKLVAFGYIQKSLLGAKLPKQINIKYFRMYIIAGLTLQFQISLGEGVFKILNQHFKSDGHQFEENSSKKLFLSIFFQIFHDKKL